MRQDYQDYIYQYAAGLFEYDALIKVWMDQSAEIALSRGDVNTALQMQEIENGFDLASYNNGILAELSKDIQELVVHAIQLIDEEMNDSK